VNMAKNALYLGTPKRKSLYLSEERRGDSKDMPNYASRVCRATFPPRRGGKGATISAERRGTGTIKREAKTFSKGGDAAKEEMGARL